MFKECYSVYTMICSTPTSHLAQPSFCANFYDKILKLNLFLSSPVKVKSFSRIQLFATPWTVAYQVPPSMGFSRQEYWSGLPFPSPDLPHPGIEPRSPAAQTVKRLLAMQEARVWFLGWEDPLEKEMAIHSSTLAWKIPWTEEPDRLQSWGRKESDTTEWLHFIFTPALQEDSLPSEPPGKSLQVQAKIQISYDILNFPVLGRKEQKRTISSAQPLYPAS